MQWCVVLLDYLKVFFSPIVTITFILFIGFMLSKKELFRLLKEIRIKYKNFEAILAMGGEKEGDKKSVVSFELKNSYAYRMSIMLILSDFIDYEKREFYCREALKNIEKSESIIKYFGTNLLIKSQRPDESGKQGNCFTRINFFLFIDNEIDPSRLKDIFENYFTENLDIHVIDYVIMRERLLKK